MIHSFSYGGGVQSTAALVLASQGKLPATDDSFRWDVFIFANVGERSEHPSTIAYVRDVALPFAQKSGVDLRTVQRKDRQGHPLDLLDRIEADTPSLPFPVRMNNGMPGKRSCTADYKVAPIEKELKAMGASKDAPAIVGIGISLDEVQRAKGWGQVDPRSPSQIREYPLLRLGLRRSDCLRIIADAGLPEPPRSACWFCPFHSTDEWQRLRRDEPDLFAHAVRLEQTINDRQKASGKQPMWLTRFATPLDQVVSDQMTFADESGSGGATCDTGSCFT